MHKYVHAQVLVRSCRGVFMQRDVHAEVRSCEVTLMLFSWVFELLRFFHNLVSGLADFLVFSRLELSGQALLEN